MGEETKPEKYKNKFEISYENYMLVRFQTLVGIIRKFMSEFGDERVLQLASEYMDELSTMQIERDIKENPIENFADFKDLFKKMLSSEFMRNTATFTIVEDSENKLTFNFSECLWADTMRKFGFDGESGYTICCKPDFAMTKAFHPNIKLSRTKTLMQGHECCNHTYSWESEENP